MRPHHPRPATTGASACPSGGPSPRPTERAGLPPPGDPALPPSATRLTQPWASSTRRRPPPAPPPRRGPAVHDGRPSEQPRLPGDSAIYGAKVHCTGVPPQPAAMSSSRSVPTHPTPDPTGAWSPSAPRRTGTEHPPPAAATPRDPDPPRPARTRRDRHQTRRLALVVGIRLPTRQPGHHPARTKKSLLYEQKGPPSS